MRPSRRSSSLRAKRSVGSLGSEKVVRRWTHSRSRWERRSRLFESIFRLTKCSTCSVRLRPSSYAPERATFRRSSRFRARSRGRGCCRRRSTRSRVLRWLRRFVAAASDARTPFKATAGLHHPVRRLDRATGFMMHGFLNLLAAAALAPRVPRETLTAIIAEEDPGAFAFDDTAFAWRDQRVCIAELQTARRSAFVSYGSCSFDDPVEDLTALNLLPPA